MYIKCKELYNLTLKNKRILNNMKENTLAEETRNTVNSLYTTIVKDAILHLKNLINAKKHDEILEDLFRNPLPFWQSLSIENIDVFSYCLEKNSGIMDQPTTFIAKTMLPRVLRIKSLPLHKEISKCLEHKFLKSDHLEPLAMCFLLKANPNLKDQDGNTALHFYVKRIIKLQDEFDSMLAKDKNYQNYISEIRPSLNHRLLLILLENGADPNIKDKEQKTVFDYLQAPIANYVQLYMQKKEHIIFGKKIIWNLSENFPLRVYNTSAVIKSKFPNHPLVTSEPALPLKQKFIIKEKALEWVNSMENEQTKSEAQHLVDSICYIDFKKFLLSLQRTIASFNDYLAQQSESEQNYILLIDPRSMNSSPWVSALALKFLQFVPDAIITIGQLESIQADKSINNILFIDDASYSGNQLSDRIQTFSNMMHMNYSALFTTRFHLAIPYMTAHTIDRLVPCGLIIHAHEKINEINSPLSKGKTLTYFQHKLAEPGISTLYFLKSILPSIQPPYKTNPLLQEEQSKIYLLKLKETQQDEYLANCISKAELEETQLPPNEREYTYTDALMDVKKFLASSNSTVLSKFSFFTDASSPAINNGERQENQATIVSNLLDEMMYGNKL